MNIQKNVSVVLLTVACSSVGNSVRNTGEKRLHEASLLVGTPNGMWLIKELPASFVALTRTPRRSVVPTSVFYSTTYYCSHAPNQSTFQYPHVFSCTVSEWRWAVRIPPTGGFADGSGHE